jgi:hypothetical protein
MPAHDNESNKVEEEFENCFSIPAENFARLESFSGTDDNIIMF